MSVVESFQKMMTRLSRKRVLVPLRTYDKEALRLKILGQVLHG